jgi:hypothetical protein
MSDGTAGGIGILLAVPLFLASLGAMAAGIILTIRLRKDWSLIILTGMSVLFIAEILTEYGSTAFYNSVPILYGIGCIAISGVWFLILRRRRFQRP